MGKTPGSSQRFAATTATVTNEAHPFLDILPKLHQATFISFGEQVHALSFADGPGVTMLGQGFSGPVEGHANIHGCITGLANMHLLVAAITHAHPNMAGGVDHFTGSFKIQGIGKTNA